MNWALLPLRLQPSLSRQPLSLQPLPIFIEGLLRLLVIAHGSFWIDLLEGLFCFPLGGRCYLSLHHFFAFSQISGAPQALDFWLLSGWLVGAQDF